MSDRMNKDIAYVSGCSLVGAIAITALVVYPGAQTDWELKLTAPDSVAVGEIAVLDVSETGASAYAYSVVPPAKCHVFEDGTKVAFASGVGGEYLFTIAAAKGDQIALIEHTVTVTGGLPPSPDSFSSRLIRAVRAVDSPDKAAELAALSDTFRTVASMIAAGVIKEPADIVKATYELNAQALGKHQQAWSGVRDTLSAELQARAEAGDLDTAEQHMAIWREIAEILKGAA